MHLPRPAVSGGEADGAEVLEWWSGKEWRAVVEGSLGAAEPRVAGVGGRGVVEAAAASVGVEPRAEDVGWCAVGKIAPWGDYL